MPHADEILRGLARIADGYLPLAALWHLAIAAALVALGVGAWRPSRRVGAAALVLPLASVSALAWAAHNPFNGAIFAAAGLALGGLATGLGPEPVRRGPGWAAALGGASIAYAWVYPHFLEGRPAWVYLVAAPVGLVPCPTLAMTLGFALLGGGFQSRAWALALGAMGVFYALFGMLRLGVWLDVGLLASAVGLCALSLLHGGKEPGAPVPSPVG